MARTRLLLLLWVLMIIIAVLLACRPGATMTITSAASPLAGPPVGSSSLSLPDGCPAQATHDAYGASSTSRSST
jgi:hypothetical protein